MLERAPSLKDKHREQEAARQAAQKEEKEVKQVLKVKK